LEIVLPVHNEARQLAASVTGLRDFLDSSFPLATVVTIADNASTDDTWAVASGLAADLSGVQAMRLERKGRGRALRAAWSASRAPVVAYMDVDLATGLDALLPLVAPLFSGHSDVAIGTRLAPGAHVVRGARREVISRCYNAIVRTALGNACTDAQCGFKAMRSDAVAVVLPLVEDDAWFFDTEVLVTARRLGLRIHEVPVDWVDDLDSRVAVARTAWLDLCGIARMVGPASRRRAAAARRRQSAHLVPGHHPAAAPSHHPAAAPSPASTTDRPARADDEVFADELLRFAGVGVVSTLAYMTLFALLEPHLGGYAANAVAIVACSLGNTAAHRGMTGTASHGIDRLHRVVTASALLGVSLVFTTCALLVTRTLGMDALVPELVAVTVANLAAAAFRFAILRTWVFRPRFGTRLGPVAIDGTGPGGAPSVSSPSADPSDPPSADPSDPPSADPSDPPSADPADPPSPSYGPTPHQRISR
jgi:putative flippase GtrA